MRQVPLQAIPNQTLSFQDANKNYDLTIRTNNIANAQIMSMDIVIDNVLVIQGQRLIPNYPVIPYYYLWDGNFIFVTENDELPDYNQFQITQYLIYATQTEIEAIINGTSV